MEILKPNGLFATLKKAMLGAMESINTDSSSLLRVIVRMHPRNGGTYYKFQTYDKDRLEGDLIAWVAPGCSEVSRNATDFERNAFLHVIETSGGGW